MPKKIYTWSQILAGDIISFRYNQNLNTVLVLNPKIPFKKKDGTKSLHLVGLKLEEKSEIRTIKSKPLLVSILETIGKIELVEGTDDIFRVDIEGTSPTRGVRKDVYTRIERFLKQNAVYRTYNFNEARKSQVFLEPIELPKNVIEKITSSGGGELKGDEESSED